MQQLGKVLTKTTWVQASNTINNNSDKLRSAISMLEAAAFKQKGYFKTATELKTTHQIAEEGSQAFVYNSSNSSSAPYDIYQYNSNGWEDTGLNGGNISVDLTKKQDTLYGYTEAVIGSKVTQIGIQGDEIVLHGDVTLNSIPHLGTAISDAIERSEQAFAFANTIYSHVEDLRQPKAPIGLNQYGQLELEVGEGLFINDGKLCASGRTTSGSSTYSEGDAISIKDNKLSVKYNTNTLKIDANGNLNVNYGEGLSIKDNKLTASTLIAKGGLAINGQKISLKVGTGLKISDDGEVFVHQGKGIFVDNERKINVNLDDVYVTTNSDGKITIQLGQLQGLGLKTFANRLAVKYGSGLTLDGTNSLTIKFGTGLTMGNDGTLYSNVQAGKNYTSGKAISIEGNEINVKYDGVTLSTKDTADNSLHVMLGSGLTQGKSGIDVAFGTGLAMGSDNKLYATVQGGKNYTSGKAISIEGNEINVKYDGVTLSTKDTADNSLHVMLGSGLTQGKSGIDVAFGTGLAMGSDNKLYATVQGGNTYVGGTGITVSGSTISLNSTTLNSINNKQNAFTGYNGLSNNNNVLSINIGSGLEVNTSNKLRVKVGTGIKIDDSDNIVISTGFGLDVDNFGCLEVDTSQLKIPTASGLAGTGLVAQNNKLAIKYSTSVLMINASGYLDINIAALKPLLGINNGPSLG